MGHDEGVGGLGEGPESVGGVGEEVGGGGGAGVVERYVYHIISIRSNCPGVKWSIHSSSV